MRNGLENGCSLWLAKEIYLNTSKRHRIRAVTVAARGSSSGRSRGRRWVAGSDVRRNGRWTRVSGRIRSGAGIRRRARVVSGAELDRSRFVGRWSSAWAPIGLGLLGFFLGLGSGFCF